MIFQVSKIKQDVRVCIDQNVSSAPLVQDDDMDMLTLQDVIGSKILEATTTATMTAGAPSTGKG